MVLPAGYNEFLEKLSPLFNWLLSESVWIFLTSFLLVLYACNYYLSVESTILIL